MFRLFDANESIYCHLPSKAPPALAAIPVAVPAKRLPVPDTGKEN